MWGRVRIIGLSCSVSVTVRTRVHLTRLFGAIALKCPLQMSSLLLYCLILAKYCLLSVEALNDPRQSRFRGGGGRSIVSVGVSSFFCGMKTESGRQDDRQERYIERQGDRK